MGGTSVENQLDSLKDEAQQCATEAAAFMDNEGGNIVAKWQSGAQV